ncbi:MAG: hypothetical protein IJV41_07360 [Oscillospiraceae bacterium]|nr:hypothetical protein [Oscillospiraceae bacterium]
MKVTKRNGNVVLFDDEKVARSILRANADTPEEELSEKIAAWIASEAFSRLTDTNDIISTQDVRRCVYSLLCEKGLPETARQYAEYVK